MVQCLFPDNSTIIGEEVEIEIEECIAEQCFQAPINYTMPVEQMQKLFGISGRCTQTLDFHCKTAPLQVIFLSVPLIWVLLGREYVREGARNLGVKYI